MFSLILPLSYIIVHCYPVCYLAVLLWLSVHLFFVGVPCLSAGVTLNHALSPLILLRWLHSSHVTQAQFRHFIGSSSVPFIKRHFDPQGIIRHFAIPKISIRQVLPIIKALEWRHYLREGHDTPWALAVSVVCSFNFALSSPIIVPSIHYSQDDLHRPWP